MKKIVLTILASALVGGLTASIITYTLLEKKSANKSQEELIKDFYQAETAVHVSPHHIRKAMSKGDNNFILVDLRSQQEYEREHILGAINIPAYKDPNTSAYGDVERIVKSFQELPTDKEIIVYCYSIPCMTGRKVGKILTDHDVYVKHLGVGWNEWRYFWNQWNHEHEWDQIDVMDYVEVGKNLNSPEFDIDIEPCSIGGELDC